MTEAEVEKQLQAVEAVLDGECAECTSKERMLNDLRYMRFSSNRACPDVWEVWECPACGTLYCP